MKWIDKLLNSVLSKKEPEVIKHTFKGKATTDQFEIALLKDGWQDGYDYTIENWTEGEGLPDGTFPEFMKHQHGFYWNGWAEGVRSGISWHYDRLFPNYKSVSWNPETKKYEVTY